MRIHFSRKLKKPDRTGEISLATAKINTAMKITAINLGKSLHQQLMELGLPMGSEIRILQHQAGGGTVVAKDNLRIALGPAIARQISVRLK